jgi:hypothetical protein
MDHLIHGFYAAIANKVTCKKEETEEGGELKTVCTQGVAL